jgi:hypothetical protein
MINRSGMQWRGSAEYGHIATFNRERENYYNKARALLHGLFDENATSWQK